MFEVLTHNCIPYVHTVKKIVKCFNVDDGVLRPDARPDANPPPFAAGLGTVHDRVDGFKGDDLINF